MQNINRELCRRLRHADNRIAELEDASRESITQKSWASCGLRRNYDQRNGVQWFSFAPRQA